MSAPQLFADRFLVSAPPGEAVDLATGEVVWLRPVALTDRLEQESWLRRCAALSGLSHPNLVALLDFGTAGTVGYFEAWACPGARPAWKSRDAEAARAVSSVVSFLMSRSLSPGRLRWSDVIDARGRPAVLPPDDAGLPLDGLGERDLARCASRLEGLLAACPGDRHRAPSLADAGRADTRPRVSGGETLELVERLADVLGTGVSGRPRAIHFPVPRESDDLLVLRILARSARIRGYVPIASRVLAGSAPDLPLPRRWREAIEQRHVLLFSGNRVSGSQDAAMFFVALGLASDRPHVWLRLGAAPSSRAPAAFVPGRSRSLALREHAADYGVAPREAGIHDQAIAHAAACGRHAEAERLLRAALGRSARRQEEAAAGEAALALGRLLLVRGRLGAACQEFERAGQHFDRARSADGAVRSAIFTGLAWTDDGRFSEAEAALRAAGIAAEEAQATSHRELATLALARCLLWQDRTAEAGECLVPLDAPPRGSVVRQPEVVAVEWARLGRATCARERLNGAWPSEAPRALSPGPCPIGEVAPAVVMPCLSSRIALAAGDLARAGRLAASALERADRGGNDVELAVACRSKAAVFAALGDVSATREQVLDGVDAARRAHTPLLALRLRIIMAAALQGAGRDGEARLLVARLARLDPARLPRVVGLALERVVRGDGRCRSPRGRPIPFPPANPRLSAGTSGAVLHARPGVVDTVVEVLDACQSSDDEPQVLRRVATLLRDRLRAVSVACFARSGDLTVVIAADGSADRSEPAAGRAIDAGLVIPPASTSSGLEAAVPIRFAGHCVGAFGCRWAADAVPDWTVAGAVLAVASAAVAPCVRTALDRRLAPAETPEAAPGEMVGVSDTVAALRREIVRAARAPFNVVIEGESGSGKELVARAIHRLGPRRHRPLCALNCAALSDELVEAELFGHSRGAFTGAVAERKGLFEEADHGTLVLDEVGELSARAQAKLLRAVQEGEVRRIGENFARSVDVRIVAATNRPLRPAAEAGEFRRDLLYRLEVIRIVVPPLRERREDIPVLAAYFWREAVARVESRCTLAPATLAALTRYDWPGNVRELQNVLAALAVAVGRRGSVGPEQLPGIIAGQAIAGASQNLEDARRNFEARFVRAALARAGGRRAQAAGDLGLTRQGLAKLMTRLGIE